MNSNYDFFYCPKISGANGNKITGLELNNEYKINLKFDKIEQQIEIPYTLETALQAGMQVKV